MINSKRQSNASVRYLAQKSHPHWNNRHLAGATSPERSVNGRVGFPGLWSAKYPRPLFYEASAQLIAHIRREKEEARGSVDAFLSEVGAGSLREYIQQCCALSG